MMIPILVAFFSIISITLSLGQSQLKMEDLGILIGTWKSQLDEKYKEHPMVKKFNPDLKGQLTVFEWGVDKKLIRISIYNLDRPNEGDTTLIIEGMIMPNPGNSSIKMLEYNAESNIYFEGTYKLDENANIIRKYTANFANGTSGKFIETWKWLDDDKKRFDWFTDKYLNNEVVQGDVVVTQLKLE